MSLITHNMALSLSLSDFSRSGEVMWGRGREGGRGR